MWGVWLAGAINLGGYNTPFQPSPGGLVTDRLNFRSYRILPQNRIIIFISIGPSALLNGFSLLILWQKKN